MKGWEGNSKYETYRDPELLRYIDENFRKPGTPCVFDSLSNSPAQLQISESSEVDGVENILRGTKASSNESPSTSLVSTPTVVKKDDDDNDVVKSDNVNSELKSTIGRDNYQNCTNVGTSVIVVSPHCKQTSSSDRKDKQNTNTAV